MRRASTAFQQQLGQLAANTLHGQGQSCRRALALTAFAPFTQDGDTLDQAVPIAAQCPKVKKSTKPHAKHKH